MHFDLQNGYINIQDSFLEQYTGLGERSLRKALISAGPNIIANAWKVKIALYRFDTVGDFTAVFMGNTYFVVSQILKNSINS